MGLSRTVMFPSDARPTWVSVRAALVSLGETPVVRMIDNLPAFPDEIPEPGWAELRVSLAGGMVTLRAAAGGWLVSIWGNADAGLLRSWSAACWAIAAAGQGSVILEDGTTKSVEEFRRGSPDSFPA